ncbi:hypothetical protein K3495_g10559 [Podosphaera aphanis]|nr:hypothetical protein K3495_g10559 [Podosphaera aphanis]
MAPFGILDRHPALIKPPLSEEVKRKRREWAEAHKDWTVEDWMATLWTDETWATDGQHKRDWVTRKIGEEVNATCVVEKVRKSLGWMFWGSFAGIEEGPCLFWEKEWGSITSETYPPRIVPLIDGMVTMRQWVSVMQDNPPSHSAAGTIEEFRERFITPIDWPPYSRDLNPIEHVWDSMNYYIQYHYPRLERGRQRSYDELRGIVKEAWNDTTKPDKLEKLIRSMPTRCEAVILAQGGPVKY